MSLLILFIIVFLALFLALWWPNIWPKMGFPELFEKLLAQFISYLAFTLMGWVSWPLYVFVFLASFAAIWWPNIWPKMGFPELFEKKNIGSIHYIPDSYPYGVSLLIPTHCRVHSLIFLFVSPANSKNVVCLYTEIKSLRYKYILLSIWTKMCH